MQTAQSHTISLKPRMDNKESSKTKRHSRNGLLNALETEEKKSSLSLHPISSILPKVLVQKGLLRDSTGGLRILACTLVLYVPRDYSCLNTNTKLQVVTPLSGTTSLTQSSTRMIICPFLKPQTLMLTLF